MRLGVLGTGSSEKSKLGSSRKQFPVQVFYMSITDFVHTLCLINWYLPKSSDLSMASAQTSDMI